jgi:hypothetical protein
MTALDDISDRKLLDDLVESGKLTEEQEEAFSKMLDDLTKGTYRKLTERQRSWAESIHARIGLDPGTANLFSTGKVKVTEQDKKGLQTFFDGLGPKVLLPPHRRKPV